jgi:hypothetical protein
MTVKTLTKEDMWDQVVGGAVLSTRGGMANRERFDAAVDPVFAKGLKVTLTAPDQIPDDAIVFIGAGIGGGLEREMVEMYPRYVPTEGRFKQVDRVFPFPKWAEIPTPEWRDVPEKRLIKLTGEPYAYMPFEMTGTAYSTAIRAAEKGKTLVDADTAAYRAVPEVSLSTLNVIHAPITPFILSTTWGDLSVWEKVLSWQRAEDIMRGLARYSGGNCSALMWVKGSVLKTGVTHNTVSMSIDIGRAIRRAKERDRDPIEAVLEVTKSFKIFEGTVAGFILEGKGSFSWGKSYIEGTGAFQGHDLQVWFKNENQVSWLDGKPYVACPDPINVLDKKTGYGLTNTAADFTAGREVVAIALKAAPLWRTERGLKIYNPKHFGFDMKYVPVEELIK